MDRMLTQGEEQSIQDEARDEAANQLSELQLMLVGGGNVTVIVG